MSFIDADKFFQFAKRKPRDEWGATLTASSKGYDLNNITPIERDYTKCSGCGGTHLMKIEIKPGRTQYKQCELCKG